MMKPIFIENFFPDEILKVAYTYSILKYSNKTLFDEPDRQSSSIIGKNSDYLMEALLDMSTRVVESNVNKKLWPTYSFFRIYDRGSDLPIHIDKPSCEYTVALCLGCDPIDKPYEIFIGEDDKNSSYKYFDSDRNLKPLKIDESFPMKPNNALIFKGMEKLHWREYCQHDHYITVFLHYVDQEGDYKDYKFDQRECLGAKKG